MELVEDKEDAAPPESIDGVVFSPGSLDNFCCDEDECSKEGLSLEILVKRGAPLAEKVVRKKDAAGCCFWPLLAVVCKGCLRKLLLEEIAEGGSCCCCCWSSCSCLCAGSKDEPVSGDNDIAAVVDADVAAYSAESSSSSSSESPPPLSSKSTRRCSDDDDDEEDAEKAVAAVEEVLVEEVAVGGEAWLVGRKDGSRKLIP